jgi:predicted transcriptional regulator
MNQKIAPHVPMKTLENRILKLLRSGPQTWDQITKEIKIGDDRLGIALGELFSASKLRTEEQDEVRIYKLRT